MKNTYGPRAAIDNGVSFAPPEEKEVSGRDIYKVLQAIHISLQEIKEVLNGKGLTDKARSNKVYSTTTNKEGPKEGCSCKKKALKKKI